MSKLPLNVSYLRVLLCIFLLSDASVDQEKQGPESFLRFFRQVELFTRFGLVILLIKIDGDKTINSTLKTTKRKKLT